MVIWKDFVDSRSAGRPEAIHSMSDITWPAYRQPAVCNKSGINIIFQLAMADHLPLFHCIIGSEITNFALVRLKMNRVGILGGEQIRNSCWYTISVQLV